MLVQSILVDADRAPQRVPDLRRRALPDRSRATRGWTDDAPLDETRLRAVRHALDAVPLDDLAGRYEGPSQGEDPHVLWMQVGSRTVSVVGERRVPELEALTERLTDAFRKPA